MSVTVIFCLRRLPELDEDAFHRHWRDVHAPLVRARAGALRIVRYVQAPRLDAAGLSTAAEARGAPPPYDGVARLTWPSLDVLRESFEDPAARRASRELLEDERRFIDLARSPIFFAEERVVVGDGA